MYRFEGYDSFITTYGHKDMPNLEAVQGLRVEEVPVITGDWVKDSCTWLKANAKRIDVLNLYHLGGRSLKHALAYKLHNPKGKVYIKFDGVPKGSRFPSRGNIYSIINLWFTKLASTEFQENTDFLSRRWHRKIICVPNPLNPNEAKDYRPFSQRSSTILTVGRLGTKQKATEILLEAFVKIADQIPNWTLKLAGRIAENVNIASDFYEAHPELKERVIFTGEITDRDEVTELYRDAKIFAFSSRWESWGIALTEAMTNGCFPVVTNIPSSYLLTEHFKFALASEVDDVDALAKNLLYACTHEPEIEALAREGRTYTLERCSLERVSNIIAENLK